MLELQKYIVKLNGFQQKNKYVLKYIYLNVPKTLHK